MLTESDVQRELDRLLQAYGEYSTTFCKGAMAGILWLMGQGEKPSDHLLLFKDDRGGH